MSQEKKVKDTDTELAAKLPMDIKHLKNLVELMVVNDLSRLELREGESHILLRRGQIVVAGTPVLHAGNPGAARAVETLAAAPASAAEASNEVLIRSPMVGTFYASADPESPPFVNVGTEIEPSTVVCLIEAMKVFNEIKAGVSGKIAKVCVGNEEAVEFGQALFLVEPA